VQLLITLNSNKWFETHNPTGDTEQSRLESTN
jgi:hypothetical protein